MEAGQAVSETVHVNLVLFTLTSELKVEAKLQTNRPQTLCVFTD